MVQVVAAEESHRAGWEEFLKSQGINHHAYSWHWKEIFTQVFGHRSMYLISLTEGKVTGILPLIYLKSLLFGKTLISLPYLNAGGIVAADRESFQALFDKCAELGKSLKANYVELRQMQSEAFYEPSAPLRTHKSSMSLKLTMNPEDLFDSFPPKLRSQVRRPSKSGVYTEVSGQNRSLEDSLDAFYAVFSEHMRDLGTPVYPRALFSNTAKKFGDRCRVITVWLENRPIAAGITLGYGNTIEIPWASALKKHNRLSPNMLLYWEAMKTGCLDGYEVFDFGRSSPDSGTYRFKQQWGATPRVLHWYYQAFHGDIPDVNPQNPKYSAIVNCWKRLPLPVANTVGPWLARSIP